jgi:predicted ATPase
MRRVILTGGPGAGKTATLANLHRLGYAVVPETARAIIKERSDMGLPPRPEPLEFALQILRSDVEQYESAQPKRSDLVFFDRSIIDALGMLAQLGQLPAAMRTHYLERFPYFEKVFVLPPWREIYRQDAQRDQSYAQAVNVHDSLRRWYVGCGFKLVALAPAPIKARCDVILEYLSVAGTHC